MENIPRVLPKNLAVQLDANKWTIPPVFGWVSKCGGVGEEEMARTFNCGVGAALVVKGTEGDNVIAAIEALGETAWCIGKVVEKSQGKGYILQGRIFFQKNNFILQCLQDFDQTLP